LRNDLLSLVFIVQLTLAVLNTSDSIACLLLGLYHVTVKGDSVPGAQLSQLNGKSLLHRPKRIERIEKLCLVVASLKTVEQIVREQ
jgi:hypothetical protein